MSVAVSATPEREAASGGCAGRRDLAARYAAGAAACAVVAAVLGGWGWALVWPAGSLAAVAWAYAIGRPGLFGKRRGRLPAWAYAVCGPYLLGQRISWWIQSRGRTPCSQLLPRVWIGQRPGRRDVEELKHRGVTSTLDLTAEFSETRALRGAAYFNLPLLDLTLPDLTTLRRAVETINEASRHGGVYVHCALGYGRTAVVAAAYLIATGRAATVEQAVERVRACRPGSVFSPQALALLQQVPASLW